METIGYIAAFLLGLAGAGAPAAIVLRRAGRLWEEQRPAGEADGGLGEQQRQAARYERQLANLQAFDGSGKGQRRLEDDD